MPVINDPSVISDYYRDELNKSLVIVRCGRNWGTGVVINKHKGIILTCSTVFAYQKDQNVTITLGKYHHEAEVVYANKPGVVFDIAVLKIAPLASLKEVLINNVTPRKGETVYSAGYAYNNQLSFSRGTITNIAPDVLLQTTCCVLNGSLGGAVIDTKGRLIGICVTSNKRCPAILSVYNHRTLAVPISAFSNILMKYLKTNDSTHLRKLTTDNPLILRDWEDYLPKKNKV